MIAKVIPDSNPVTPYENTKKERTALLYSIYGLYVMFN